MIEAIAIALLTHLGKKVIDNFWDARKSGSAPIVDDGGHLGFTAASQNGRTLVNKSFSVPLRQASELVYGDLYLPQSIQDILVGDETAIVLVIEEAQSQVLLFTADVDNGYAINLPHGNYYFYTFIVDSDADDLLNAMIYAVGFPSGIDLSTIDRFTLDDHDDIWDYVNDVPYEIGPGGPYYLDFILIDTDEVPDFPVYFSELWEGDESEEDYYDLSGQWKLKDKYGTSRMTGDAHLTQTGNQLSGYIVISDVSEDGNELVVQEQVTGIVDGAQVTITGASVRILRGRSKTYYLDQWSGVIEDDDKITGQSVDAAGSAGRFVMRRVQ